jgi:hypothetical protein
LAKIADFADSKSSTYEGKAVQFGFGYQQYRDPVVENMALYPEFIDVYSFGRILARMLMGPIDFDSEENKAIKEARFDSLVHRMAWLCVQTQTFLRPTAEQIVEEFERFELQMFQPSPLLFDFELQQKDPRFELAEHESPIK